MVTRHHSPTILQDDSLYYCIYIIFTVVYLKGSLDFITLSDVLETTVYEQQKYDEEKLKQGWNLKIYNHFSHI